MQLKFTSNVDQLQKRINLIATSQLPYVVSLALNRTAIAAKDAVQARMKDVFDKPVDFTVNAAAIRYANRSNLVAFVFVKEKQAGYLKRQEAGGTRTPENTAGAGKKSFLIPIKDNVDLNQFGNLSRNKVKSLKTRKDVFVGNVHGHGGIYQRLDNGKLKMLIAFENRSEYKKNLNFKKTVNAVAFANLKKNFQDAWSSALASYKA
jgi:hypothetical protein